MVTKPYHSPNQVTYDDLIAFSEERLRRLIAQRGSGWHYQHEVEVQKKMVMLFKKFKKDPQTDLFKEFEKLK